jgi:hypothetical protein
VISVNPREDQADDESRRQKCQDSIVHSFSLTYLPYVFLIAVTSMLISLAKSFM